MRERDTASPRAERALETKTCPRCGARFACGAHAGHCWCEDLPPLLAVPDRGAACHCPACLMEIAAGQRR
ncbi:MAG: cysteine-rich CWC family protein [Azoarcus sp.]|nr:cysteine-rich CWC family protein [Azoarcus sp.]